MEAAQNYLHSWIPSLPEIFAFLIEKNVHSYIHSFMYSFLLQTCIECLLPGHTLFWGHSGEQGKMEALTLVEHLIVMQRDSKWTKMSVNLMTLGSSRCWSGSKYVVWQRGSGWQILVEWFLNGKVKARAITEAPSGEMSLARRKNRKQVSVAGGQSQGEWLEMLERWKGTKSWGALLPFQFSWFSFSLSCLYYLKQANKQTSNISWNDLLSFECEG